MDCQAIATAALAQFKADLKAEIMAEMQEGINQLVNQAALTTAQMSEDDEVITTANLLEKMNEVADDFIEENSIGTNVPDFDDYVEKSDLEQEISDVVRSVLRDATITI